MNENINKLERSYGVNADINYKTKFADGDVSFSINHLFFYTRIMILCCCNLTGATTASIPYSGHIDSRGMETNIKIGL